LLDTTAGRLSGGPQFTCPACQRAVPVINVPEWFGTLPCDPDPDGPLYLDADGAVDAASHPVARINGRRNPNVRLTAHAYRCPANGLFAEFHSAGLILLDEPGQTYPRPVWARYATHRDGRRDRIVARCLLPGGLLLLEGHGQHTGERVDATRLAERTGLDAEHPIEDPMVAACRAAWQAGARAPGSVTALVLVDAGVLGPRLHNGPDLEWWWTSAIAERCIELRDGIPQMRCHGETLDPIPDDPIDLLAAFWLQQTRGGYGWTNCAGIDTARARAVHDAISDEQWRARAAFTDAVLAAMRAAYTAADQAAQQRLADWRERGPEAIAAADGAAIQMALNVTSGPARSARPTTADPTARPTAAAEHPDLAQLALC